MGRNCWGKPSARTAASRKQALLSFAPSLAARDSPGGSKPTTQTRKRRDELPITPVTCDDLGRHAGGGDGSTIGLEEKEARRHSLM